MREDDKPVGLVLAGGRGKRMGRTKGDLVLGDRNLAERAAATLAPFCRSVLVSIARGADNPVPACIALEDAPPAGRGPLAGIARAFDAIDRADLFVLACDYPRVDHDLIARIVTSTDPEDDIVMPVDSEGRDHPLVALWSRRMAGPVRQALEAGRYAVRDLVRDARVRRLGADDRAVANVNTPDDLKRG